MPVTIKDVARESGVNISTVSRALNDGYGVHHSTREHVLAVAARLNYRPNRVARGLVTGKSNTLALIISDIRNPFFAEVARGAEDAARAGDCDLVLCNSDLDADKQMRYVASLLEKRVDGILMNSVAALTRAQRAQLAECGVPIVLLNRPATQSRTFSSVGVDNFAGGQLAAEYLCGLGHRYIAQISGPRRHGNMTDRARGFLHAVRDKGLPCAPVTLHGENSFSGGHALMRQVMEEHPQVTAVFTGNDLMAFGAVRAVLEAGRRVPDDISLIGFDGVELASVIYPPLTTIRQPSHEIGQAAVEILLKQGKRATAEARDPEHRTLVVELVERQSCRALRSE